MSVSLSDILPELPCDETAAPVARLEAGIEAFALVLALHERGAFTWPEWAAALTTEIKAAQAAGDPDTGATYYQHWLKALERLTVEKGAATPAALQDKAAAWDRAARATPHGQPITL